MRLLSLALVVVVPTLVWAGVDHNLQTASDRFSAYLEDIRAGNWDAATAHWRTGDAAIANRLGIHYADVPVKVDGDSPLWVVLPSLRDSTAVLECGSPFMVNNGPFAGMIMLPFTVRVGASLYEHRYLFTAEGDDWILASPVRLVADQGMKSSGRYVTVYECRRDASWPLPSYFMANLDSCVASMASRLELSDSCLAILEGETLHYLLASPDLVESLAGAPTVGVANLQVDAVVTHHPCHAHELAHLLVNVWLEDMPLYTLPLLQEGLATSLGGRWGRHPRVLNRLGRTMLESETITLDELLTRDEFYQQSADMTYAPAGVFADYLLSQFGAAGLRAAYLACSGSAAEVSAWNAIEVKRRIAAALNTPWDRLHHCFMLYVTAGGLTGQASPKPPLRPGIVPWTSLADSADPLVIEAGRLRLTVVQDRACDFGFEVRSAEVPVRGVLLVGGSVKQPVENALFAEHFGSRPYRGESFGLLFNPDEAKLYDYQRQMLVALHAEGFWPSEEPGFCHDDGFRLQFTLEAELMPSGDWSLVDLSE